MKKTITFVIIDGKMIVTIREDHAKIIYITLTRDQTKYFLEKGLNQHLSFEIKEE